MHTSMPSMGLTVLTFPANPALQRQAVGDMLVLGELEFARQLRQLEFPLYGLYVPATHGKQLPPTAPVHPALQVQASIPVLVIGEYESDGHFMQFLGPIYMLTGHPQKSLTGSAHQFITKPRH